MRDNLACILSLLYSAPRSLCAGLGLRTQTYFRSSLLSTRKVTFRVKRNDHRKYVCVRRLRFPSLAWKRRKNHACYAGWWQSCYNWLTLCHLCVNISQTLVIKFSEKGIFNEEMGEEIRQWINKTVLDHLSPNSDQHQFSPNHIHMLPREIVMGVNKMIT